MSVLDGQPNRFLKNAMIELPGQHFSPLTELLDSVEVSSIPVKTPRYSLSRTLARRVGIIPALVMPFISRKVYDIRNMRDGKPWYYNPYREIATRYKFISAISVYRAIQKLEAEGFVELGNHNHRKRDLTTWYTVNAENRVLCEGDLIYFSPDDAEIVGLKAAIVYAHLKYSLENKPAILREGWLRVWPSDLAEVQPLSKGEIRSALRKLVGMGYLDRRSDGACEYRLGSNTLISGVCDFEADPLEIEAEGLPFETSLP